MAYCTQRDGINYSIYAVVVLQHLASPTEEELASYFLKRTNVLQSVLTVFLVFITYYLQYNTTASVLPLVIQNKKHHLPQVDRHVTKFFLQWTFPVLF